MPLANQAYIGTTFAGMVTLQSLGIPDPSTPHEEYSTLVEAASGLPKGHGSLMHTWQWGFLTAAQRNILRTYIPGVGATIYIRTLINDSDAWADYKVIATWPPEERYAGRRLDFSIRMRIVEAAS